VNTSWPLLSRIAFTVMASSAAVDAGSRPDRPFLSRRPQQDTGCLDDMVRRDWLHFKWKRVSYRRQRPVEKSQSEKASDKTADMGFPGDLTVDARRVAEQAGG